ncbi:HNH endonuclease signature motif containing protein [Methylovulum psychrotolerans]|uniref:HNH endonuclease signature motif containing protein n=1 Tax=Methylovulum psychrotolerans TaxID=1704499 RepID=UPI0018E01E80|nr:HNH endonuclease signature motif containing protein [Methylovulum psychrotolerans]
MKKLLISIFIILALAASAVEAKQERSQAAKDLFKRSHPCPSNGNDHGSCPGYVIDHVEPLACGGKDAPENMQWQTETEGKAKDKWERKGCQVGQPHSAPTQNNGYYTGPRGGCYTLIAGGKKRYVAHSFCRG